MVEDEQMTAGRLRVQLDALIGEKEQLERELAASKVRSVSNIFCGLSCIR